MLIAFRRAFARPGSKRSPFVTIGTIAALALGGCATSDPKSAALEPPAGATISTKDGEMPSWQIPNMPVAAEAYYAPDNRHLIAQAQSDKAVKSPRGMSGFLTMTFTDAGEEITLVNDKGWDACSYYFPDGKRLVWTSIKDNLALPLGNWSDWRNYPQGAELYISDLKGGNVQRLTSNQYYEAEVTVSPNGKWIVFGRQIDGKMDLWRMKSDGTGETRITNTPDWEEGAPYYLPDNETVMFRAWRGADYGVKKPTPMTIFTIKHDGTELKPRTFTDDMNWAPYPAPNGRHFVFVRAETPENWEVYLGDMQGGAPRRLTFDDNFDGFPSLSPDGRKMVWTSSRSTGKGFMGLQLHVMDVSSLKLGPK